MGVKGLTTYIANKAEQYLKPFELHDCLLVIDGDSLASNLYNWSADCNSAFGGDYDVYHRIVTDFFEQLQRCNVRSFVLLDGGYEKRKLRTVQQRLRDKIAAIKHINPIEGHHLFPLMMREVFVEAVRSSPGVQVMRCLFEADDEVAMLARQLNCPVLSYDSDFYIHNVQYIPSVSLTIKVLKRTAPRRNRRKPAATSKAASAAFRPYHYMDCCVYTIANLAGNQIRDEVLPLFGTLLGNDYINRVVFKKFFDNISTRNIGKRNSPQQKRIIALLRWLRGESLESAIAKVLDRVEKTKKVWLAGEINEAMAGYVRADSKAFTYFGLTNDDVMTKDVSEHICEEEGSDDEQCSEIEDQIDSGSAEEDELNSDEESVEQTDRAYRNADVSKDVDIPAWLLPRLLAAELPRYTIDLLSLRMYINSPQVENFQLPDSNDLALPILQLIFTILHHPNPPPDQFQYLTRIQRASNVHFRSIAPVDASSIEFNPDDAEANLSIFRSLFASQPGVIETAQTLSVQHQLFFLCLVYVGQHSKHLSVAHFHSLIISLLVLNDATRLCPPIPKKAADFEKKFAKRLSELGTRPDKDGQAVLLYCNVLPHFALNPRIRSRHTEFSSTTLHGFAELQAVMFQMGTLNALLGKPFGPMSAAHLCNGSLWYNLAEALKPRADISHYVRLYVFAGCETFFDMYSAFLGTLQPFVNCLAGPREVTRKMTRNRRKKDKKKIVSSVKELDKVCEKTAIGGADSESDGAFDDINNQFAALRVCV